MLLRLQASLTVYVLVMTSGQLPAAASTWLTARFASLVHASLTLTPSASSSVTLVNATGAALALHPSTTAGASVPVINGAVVSWIAVSYTHLTLPTICSV